MKKHLLLSVMLFLALAGKAQTALTTYYVIPPTSGCNGVWAIDAQTAACGMQYVFTPSVPQACAQFASISTNGDTLYMNLCAIPCGLNVFGPNGPCAVGSTGTTVAVDAPVGSSPVLTTYPNPINRGGTWTVQTAQPAATVRVQLFNLAGQCVLDVSGQAPNQRLEVAIGALAPGTYAARMQVDEQAAAMQKLVVVQ